MHCGDSERLIVRHSEAPVSSDEEQRLRQHLSECEGCREALARQRQVSDILAGRPTAMVSADFAKEMICMSTFCILGIAMKAVAATLEAAELEEQWGGSE